MRDTGHYGYPPPPRDETRPLRVVARVLVFLAAGFVTGAVVSLILGWR